LELINVHNLVGSNLPGMHYTTNKNGNSYNGVFMGDGGIVSNQANGTLQNIDHLLEQSEVAPGNPLSVSMIGSIRKKKKSGKKLGEKQSLNNSIELSETVLSRYKNNDGSIMS